MPHTMELVSNSCFARDSNWRQSVKVL